MKNPKSNGSKPVTRSLFDHGKMDTGSSKFDWNDIDRERLWRLIDCVTNAGGAVRIGYSRDGAAGSLGIYYGDARDTVYIRPSDDPWEILGTVERWCETLPNNDGKSPG